MPSGKSTYQVVIDSSGAKRGARVAVESFQAIQRAASKTNDALRRFGSSTISGFKKMANAAKAFGKVVSSLSKPFSMLKSFVAGAFTGGVLKGIVEAGLSMQKFRTTMTVVTGTTAKANKELEWLRTVTDRVGVSFQDAATPFARFAAAAQEILSGDQIREVFSGFSEASAALRLNQQEINGVFLALQQMASKGKVSMEELRLQLAERIPGAMRIAADVMGMTVGQLEDAVRAGSIKAEDFLVRFARAISEKFGKAAVTASESAIGAFARFRTAIFQATAAIAEGGLLDALADAAARLSQFINNNMDGLREIGRILGEMATKAVDFVTGLKPENVRAFIQMVKNGFQDILNVFTAIGNSNIYKNLTRSDEEWAITDQLKEVDDQLTNLYSELDRRRTGFFSHIMGGEEGIKRVKETIKNVLELRQKLIADLEKERGVVAFIPITNKEVSDNLQKTGQVAKTALKPLPKMLADNTKELEKQRRALEKLRREEEAFQRDRQNLLRIGRGVGTAQGQREEALRSSILVMTDLERKFFDIRVDQERALFVLKERYDKLAAKHQGDSNRLAQLKQDYESTADSIVSSFDKVREAAQVTDQISRSWQQGAIQSMHDYSQAASDAATNTARVFETAFKGMEDSLVNFIMTGKLSFNEMANAIVADISRIIIKQQIANALMGMSGGGVGGGVFGSLFGSLMGGPSAGSANVISTSSPAPMAGGTSMFDLFANGGAFSNGIVKEPTMFKFANGAGMMGEAGPEAIMPLTRMPGGQLGVRSSGDSEPTVNLGGIHITTQDADSFNESRDQVMSTVMAAMSQARRNA